MPPAKDWVPHIEGLPFHGQDRELIEYGHAKELEDLGLGHLNLKAYQIPVWVSITDAGETQCPGTAKRIPALLDTGSTNNFSLRQSHLELSHHQIRPAQIGDVWPTEGTGGPVFGINVSVDIWLHSYAPPERTVSELPPLPMSFGGRGGIICYPTHPIESRGVSRADLIRRLTERTLPEPEPDPKRRQARRPRPASGRPTPLQGPRLPILGIRGLCLTGLALEVHCRDEGGEVFVYAPPTAYGKTGVQG